MNSKKEYHWDNNNLIKYKDALAEKLKKDFPYWADGVHEKIAKEDLTLINPIFEKNIVEYINDEVYSDIPVGSRKLTLNMLLEFTKNTINVIEILKVLSIYSLDEDEGNHKITNWAIE